ncbi:MAG: hypothetical protein HY775_00235 [Acidobacteria bacterium]|nr:hypothetical protein [Acidobacteriota bacterium]
MGGHSPSRPGLPASVIAAVVCAGVNAAAGIVLGLAAVEILWSLAQLRFGISAGLVVLIALLTRSAEEAFGSGRDGAV